MINHVEDAVANCRNDLFVVVAMLEALEKCADRMFVGHAEEAAVLVAAALDRAKKTLEAAEEAVNRIDGEPLQQAA